MRGEEMRQLYRHQCFNSTKFINPEMMNGKVVLSRIWTREGVIGEIELDISWSVQT